MIRIVIQFLIFCLLATLAYWPAIQGEFLWDDLYLVCLHPLVRSPVFIAETFNQFLFWDSPSRYYRPVQVLSYMFDYWINQFRPIGYHISNIFLHTLAGFLLFQLIRRLFAQTRASASVHESLNRKFGIASFDLGGAIALGIALLWIVHPVHNAAVAYISGRADPLAFVFGALAWILATTKISTQNQPLKFLCLLGVFLCFVLSACSREIGLIWMVLFLGWSLFFSQKLSLTENAFRVAVCCFAFGAYIFLRNLPEANLPPINPGSIPLGFLLLLCVTGLGFYISQSLFPFYLTMDRELIARESLSSFQAWITSGQSVAYFLLGMIVIVTLMFCWCRRGDYLSLRRLGVFWFLAAWLPISNLVPMNAHAADHWLYLPLPGILFILAGFSIERLAIKQPTLQFQKIISIISIIFLVFFIIQTNQRADDWQSSEKLYSVMIATGVKSHRAKVNLASALMKHGQVEAAKTLLLEVLDENPDHYVARPAIVALYERQGNPELAARWHQQKVSPKPTNKTSAALPGEWKPGIMKASKLVKDPATRQEALLLTENTYHQSPHSWDTANFLSSMYAYSGDKARARGVWADYAERYWWHLPSRLMLARTYLGMDRTDEALVYIKQAMPLDIHSPIPPLLLIQASLQTPNDAQLHLGLAKLRQRNKAYHAKLMEVVQANVNAATLAKNRTIHELLVKLIEANYE